MRKTREHHDLYLKTDVLLLKYIFEQFREICPHYYKLDPRHFGCSVMLSWDAILKLRGAVLELMTDIDIVQFTEKGMIDQVG